LHEAGTGVQETPCILLDNPIFYSQVELRAFRRNLGMVWTLIAAPLGVKAIKSNREFRVKFYIRQKRQRGQHRIYEPLAHLSMDVGHIVAEMRKKSKKAGRDQEDTSFNIPIRIQLELGSMKGMFVVPAKSGRKRHWHIRRRVRERS
jgi:hypothetical protein